MKQKYQQPQVDYVLFNAEDVIRTSDIYIEASAIFGIPEEEEYY